MKFFVKFLDKFELFVKRAMMPSIVFFIILSIVFMSAEYLLSDICIYGFLTCRKFGLENSFSMSSLVIFLIFLIGLSHILALFTQMFFDNKIKNNYNTIFQLVYKKQENKELNILRAKVIQKLKDEKVIYKKDNCEVAFNNILKESDVMLYQIVGRKLSYFENKTNTERYVDDTKASGITFISLILSIGIVSLLMFKWYIFDIALIAMKVIHIIGLEHLKTKFRSRAIRMYINFLIGEK